jgi:hypothetical protein
VLVEEEMAARDLLNLNNSIAPRLIRCLYIAALILITVMVLLGVMRGIRIMNRPMMPPAAITNSAAAPAAPDATTPPQGAMGQRFADRRMMMDRRFDRSGRRRFGMFGMGRNPMLGGLFVILGALLRGAIILMIVRILAELGLAILAMPRRSEI